MRDDVVLRFAQRALGKPSRLDRRDLPVADDPATTPRDAAGTSGNRRPELTQQAVSDVLANRLAGAGVRDAQVIAETIGPLVAGDLAALLVPGPGSATQHQPPDPSTRLSGSRSRLPDPPRTPAFDPPTPPSPPTPTPTPPTVPAAEPAPVPAPGSTSPTPATPAAAELTDELPERERPAPGGPVEGPEVIRLTEVAEERPPRRFAPSRDQGETPLGFTLD